jgi:hypothetical protein
MTTGPFSLELVAAAFAGGAFGAAIGALPSFAFTGFLVIVGELHALVRRGLTAGGDAAIAAVPITSDIAFGPVFGPHVAFGGGAAAAAYAARQGYFDPDPEFPYHPAKRIAEGLGTRADVLAVGGAFGILGHLIAAGSAAVNAPWDPVALGVVGSALAHRLAFGYGLVGPARTGLLDMAPFERGERRGGSAAADGGETATDGGTTETARFVVEPWLPHQYRWRNVALLGLVVGVLGAYVAYLTASAFLAFGISAATLLYINAGVPKVPVTHHMTLPASTAVLAAAPGTGLDPAALAAAVPFGTALALGAAFGVLGALAGELCQRVLYAHAATHLDPPAASIVCTSLLIAVLAMLGVFPDGAWIPMPIGG